MNFLKILKKDVKEATPQVPNEIADIQTKYEVLVSEINKLIKDGLLILQKDSYYLALNKIANDNGVKESSIWVDYYMGRVSATSILLGRLLRIMGEDTNILNEIVLSEKNRAIDDINRCQNIMELLNKDNNKKKENNGKSE